MTRIPNGISKSYKRYKAEEWKVFTLVYLLYCLKGIIPDNHYAMWSVYVNACHLLCQRSITTKDVETSHNLLKIFCSAFAKNMGPLSCTPNMHMHMHLKDCIKDFGPVYSFWCFAFERFNGILGKYQTNNHAISIQVMRKTCHLNCNFVKVKSIVQPIGEESDWFDQR